MKVPTSIPEDPYAFARISAMKGALLKRPDYDKLLKMGPSEMLRYLQERGYRKEIDELESRFSGARLIEIAVAKHAETILLKLRRITNPALSSLIELFARRYDAHNIKVVLRAVQGEQREGIADLMMPSGIVSKNALTEIAKSANIDEAITKLRKQRIISQRSPNNLSELEDYLTKDYYEKSLTFAKNLPLEAGAFSQFLINEVECLNIITVIKLRNAGMDDETIKSKLMSQSKIARKLLRSQRVDDMFEALKSTKYRHAAEVGATHFSKEKSIINFETQIWRGLLTKNLSLVRKHPLSIDVILGFMFAKGIEARNLRIIAKAKELGLSEQFVEGELVV